MLQGMGKALCMVTVVSSLLGTVAHAECKQPIENELIELAIDAAFERQLGYASTLDHNAERVTVSYKQYSSRSAYLGANPNCCEITTREALAKMIPPEFKDQMDYFGSVRVVANVMILSEPSDVLDPTNLRMRWCFTLKWSPPDLS